MFFPLTSNIYTEPFRFATFTHIHTNEPNKVLIGSTVTSPYRAEQKQSNLMLPSPKPEAAF